MANARERAKTERENKRQYQLDRIAAATDPSVKLAYAWSLWLAEWRRCTDPEAANRIGRVVLQTLIEQSAKLPRRVA